MFLIRHGATANNLAVPPKLQGRRSDPPLSEAGGAQAHRTAEALAPLPIARVYSSPLLRARQTAEAIATRHNVKAEIAADLIEIDVGAWEGWTWDEAERAHPEAYARFKDDPTIHPYLDGENLNDVVARSTPALEQILAANRGRTVAVVSHNMVIRCYLARLLGLPLSCYRTVVQDNCGISLVRWRSHDGTRPVTVNSVMHLLGP